MTMICLSDVYSFNLRVILRGSLRVPRRLWMFIIKWRNGRFCSKWLGLFFKKGFEKHLHDALKNKQLTGWSFEISSKVFLRMIEKSPGHHLESFFRFRPMWHRLCPETRRNFDENWSNSKIFGHFLISKKWLSETVAWNFFYHVHKTAEDISNKRKNLPPF